MWGNYVLELIVTNLHNLFDKPCILAPLGSSDHSIVHWIHTVNDNMSKLYTKPIKLLVRRYPRLLSMLSVDGLVHTNGLLKFVQFPA